MNKKVCTSSRPAEIKEALENRFASYSFEISGQNVHVLDITDMHALDEMKEFVNGYSAAFFKYAGQLETAHEVIRNMQAVTKILGTGIAHVAADANFFALWNNTEVAATRILNGRE